MSPFESGLSSPSRVRVFKKGPSIRVFESESRLGSAPTNWKEEEEGFSDPFQTPPPPPLSGEIEKGRGEMDVCVCALGRAAGEIKRTNRERGFSVVVVVDKIWRMLISSRKVFSKKAGR